LAEAVLVTQALKNLQFLQIGAISFWAMGELARLRHLRALVCQTDALNFIEEFSTEPLCQQLQLLSVTFGKQSGQRWEKRERKNGQDVYSSATTPFDITPSKSKMKPVPNLRHLRIERSWTLDCDPGFDWKAFFPGLVTFESVISSERTKPFPFQRYFPDCLL
jgi:hypothetical protein